MSKIRMNIYANTAMALVAFLTAGVFPEASHAMSDKTYSRLSKIIAQENHEETEERTSYYEYLVKEKGEKESLKEHLNKYAQLASFGKPLADSSIRDFHPALPFPKDLINFYTTYGSFSGSPRLHDLTIYNLDALRARREAPVYSRFHSLGLADMINYNWGNSRDELNISKEAAIFSQEQIDYLNKNYQVIGVWTDASWSDEAHYYIYYDKSGRFGIEHMHQDTWEIFHLLKSSGARYSFDQVMNVALDMIKKYKDSNQE